MCLQRFWLKEGHKVQQCLRKLCSVIVIKVIFHFKAIKCCFSCHKDLIESDSLVIEIGSMSLMMPFRMFAVAKLSYQPVKA